MSMVFYKIIRDGTTTDAGFVFLKWNEHSQHTVACDVNEAQFIQSFDQEHIYHVDWLKPVPEAAGQYETVQAAVIDSAEFDEIRALLDDGEPVPNEPEPPAPEPVEDQEQLVEPEERPMTVGEMRQLITEQQERIAMLEDCLLEMSEIVYGGE